MNKQPTALFPLFADRQESILKHLALLVSSLDEHVKADVSQVFHDPERLFGAVVLKGDERTYAGISLLFPFLIAQYIESDIDPDIAASVAAAIMCFISALDLLDDIEEEKHTALLDKLGLARVLNISTALLALAQRSILTLPSQSIASEQRVVLLTLMQDAILKR